MTEQRVAGAFDFEALRRAIEERDAFEGECEYPEDRVRARRSST